MRFTNHLFIKLSRSCRIVQSSARISVRRKRDEGMAQIQRRTATSKTSLHATAIQFVTWSARLFEIYPWTISTLSRSVLVSPGQTNEGNVFFSLCHFHVTIENLKLKNKINSSWPSTLNILSRNCHRRKIFNLSRLLRVSFTPATRIWSERYRLSHTVNISFPDPTIKLLKVSQLTGRVKTAISRPFLN